jgi:anti-anti-sigma factor
LRGAGNRERRLHPSPAGYKNGAMLSTLAQEIEDGVWVLDLHGELDLTTAGALKGAVEAIVPEHPLGLAVDLADVPFMDSSGISALVMARKRLHDVGAFLAVLRPHPMPRSLLQRTNLDHLLLVSGSLHEAFERAADTAVPSATATASTARS